MGRRLSVEVKTSMTVHPDYADRSDQAWADLIGLYVESFIHTQVPGGFEVGLVNVKVVEVQVPEDGGVS